MENIEVSVVVPIYNCEKLVGSCVTSILQQTYTNFEVILIDDGSNDNSYKICKDFASKDKRIKLYHIQNSGASRARNLGILKSVGKYIMFIDADDYIEDTMVENLIHIAKNKDADFVMCGMIIDKYNEVYEVIDSKKYILNPRIILRNKDIAENIFDLIENEKINGPVCKLIRMSIIRENNIQMPEHISLQEDLYFNLCILKYVERMVVTEQCYYHYRKGTWESVTNKYYPNKYEMITEVHRLLVQFYINRCKNKNLIHRIYYIYIKNVYAACINLFHDKCILSKAQKLQYIREIVQSKEYAINLKRADRKGVKYKILKGILLTKSKMIIYFASKCFYMLKFKLGVKY